MNNLTARPIPAVHRAADRHQRHRSREQQVQQLPSVRHHPAPLHGHHRVRGRQVRQHLRHDRAGLRLRQHHLRLRGHLCQHWRLGRAHVSPAATAVGKWALLMGVMISDGGLLGWMPPVNVNPMLAVKSLMDYLFWGG